MRALCAEAHRHGVRVEQVIVLLKQLWAALPADGTSESRSASREGLEEIITACIDAYYADGAAGRGVPTPGTARVWSVASVSPPPTAFDGPANRPTAADDAGHE
jgi:hypothetical protein